jgi:hypothetical protein
MATSLPFLKSDSQAMPEVQTRQLIGGLKFDRVMGILSLLWVGGLYLDGWAHGHGKVDKTFFTPWHAILYSAFVITASCLLFTVASNHRKGVSWKAAIPDGYGLSVIGVPIFAVSGPADLLWHSLFGFEVGIEPLLSPSHLSLAFGGVLVVTGPIRAAWRRAVPEHEQGWKTLLPLIFSLIATLMIFTFFTDFAHPFSHLGTIIPTNQTNVIAASQVSSQAGPVVTTPNNQAKSFGAADILLEASLLIGFLLLAVSRWRLPLGSMTLLFTLYVTGLSVLNDQYQLIPAVVAAGIITDVLLRVLRTTTSRTELRIFAFAVPLILYLLFFLTLQITATIAWSIHLWLGACVMAGIAGLMLSFLIVPPKGPADMYHQ